MRHKIPDDWGQEGWRARLRQARADQHLSRNDVARISGLSVSTLKQVESGFRINNDGSTEPYGTTARVAGTLYRLAKAVGLDPMRLVLDAGWKAADIPTKLIKLAVPDEDGGTIQVMALLVLDPEGGAPRVEDDPELVAVVNGVLRAIRMGTAVPTASYSEQPVA
jgi:transcriptional regulator with XRE-family HTH domain